MKKFFVLLMLVLVAFVGCDSSTGTDDNTGDNGDPGDNGGVTGAALYPLKQGATWNYDSVYNVYTYDIDETVVDKITGSETMDGKTYWVLTSTTYDSDGTEDDTETAYLRYENNIVYTYDFDFFLLKTAGEPVAPALKALQYGEMATFKLNVSAGTTWEIYRYDYSGADMSLHALITGTYVGRETVGSYANCAKFVLEYRTESLSSSLLVAGIWNRTVWLAPNVGPVKSVVKFSSGDTLDTVELLSTQTNTLTSVELP